MKSEDKERRSQKTEGRNKRRIRKITMPLAFSSFSLLAFSSLPSKLYNFRVSRRRLTSSMARVTSMPRGQASTQLNTVRHRQTPSRL